MKIFTAEKIRLADDFTITHEPISSLKLMERASKACVDFLSEYLDADDSACIFCGNGNNGGDGFTIARMLYQKGFHVEVFIDTSNFKFSKDADVQLNILKTYSGISIHDYSAIFDFKFIKKPVFIDAFFGTGLSRKIVGNLSSILSFINKQEAKKIAIDIPTGLFSDKNIEDGSAIFHADVTLTFQFWKRSFLHPETGLYVGNVIVLDIGLHPEYIAKTETSYFSIDEKLILEIFKPRNEFSHKGTYGKVEIIGGSFGKIGAAVLATQSALRSGAGLTFVQAPNCGYDILQTTCPEAMFIDAGDLEINNLHFESEKTYGVGPGIGTSLKTKEALHHWIKNVKNPLILDADALNILAQDEISLKNLPENSIITPHPKEFERLFGTTKDSYERLELAREKAIEYQLVIVLKDYHTQVIDSSGQVYYNLTGNSGLAKGGSGDVLTGIITSLLAQKYCPLHAALLGVYIHGSAADFAAKKYSKEAMLPTDVINTLGEVFLEINKKVTT